MLDARNAGASRKLLLNGGGSRLSLRMFSGWSLPGMVEFYHSLQSVSEGVEHIWNEIESGEPEVEHWKTLHSVWSERRQATLDTRAVAASVDFLLLNSTELSEPKSVPALRYSEFQQRFVKAAKNAGFVGKFPSALAGVMHEMADNVFQHSSLQLGGGGKGLIGVHASDGYLSFTVSDLGVGILSSLRTSIEWSALKTDREGLEAIVRERASRKMGLGEGEGFKQLFRSLVDRNAAIRIRSGCAAFSLGQDGDTRHGSYSSAPHLDGVQISLVCTREGRAEERGIF